MLFAAGLGTRLYPITKEKPKALVEVNGQTLLERNLRYLQTFGIEEVVVNIHHFADLMKEEINRLNQILEVQIQVSDESDELLETGGGLMKARDFFENDFLVMNVDILTDMNLTPFIEFHTQNEALASLAVSDRASSRKLFFDNENQLRGWKNFKTEETKGSTEYPLQEKAFSGIHIINPKLFDKIENRGKFSIMKPYLELMESEPILGYDHSGDTLIDVGKLDTLEQAQKLFQ